MRHIFGMVDDWRLENLKMGPPLRGLRFLRKSYTAYRPDWDHDHCVACNRTLAEPSIEGEYVAHEGYATTADYEKGADYEWICVECFQDFKDVMVWDEV